VNSIEYEDKKGLVRDIIEVEAGTTYATVRSVFVRAIINAAKSVL